MALSYDLLYFCLPAGRFTEVCVIVFSTSPYPHRMRVVVFVVGMSSFKPGWLCGSSLDNARGVFVCVIEDGWAVFDVIPVPIVCNTGVVIKNVIVILQPVWCRDVTLTGTTILSQSGIETNGNEVVLDTLLFSRTRAPPPDAV